MILDEIADHTRQRVARLKKNVPFEAVRDAARSLPAVAGFPFEAALRAPGLSFLCEVKRASPSRGVIAPDFPYLDIARDYAHAGAAALSVLTEPEFFLGSDAYLREIAAELSLPVLRKDFTVDEYQIYEAKTLGASAVLLICALLDGETLGRYISLAHSLGLSALVEAHSEQEVAAALGAGARIVGVNNRDLRDFTEDLSTSVRLRPLVPTEILFVSESGIRTPADTALLARCGADAVLVGEALMRSPDKAAALAALRGDA